MSVSITAYDCATDTVTGTVSGGFPNSVCAYAYCAPVSSPPECAPMYAKCMAWADAQVSPGSLSFQIPGVPRQAGCTSLEVVVWTQTCNKDKFSVNCTTTTTTTQSPMTASMRSTTTVTSTGAVKKGASRRAR